MTHFVEDDTTLPFPKTDLVPLPGGADQTKYVRAADWNDFGQASEDVKDWLRGLAKWYAMVEQASDPAPAGVTRYLWPKNDGRLHWKGSGGDKELAFTSDLGGIGGVAVDLSQAPYSVVAGSSGAATANTAAIKQAIADYNGLGANLRLPRGDIYLDQDGTSNWHLRFGPGVGKIAVSGHGPKATRIILQAVGDAGETAGFEFDQSNGVSLSGFTIQHGIIQKPDGAQRNFLIRLNNTHGGGAGDAGMTRNTFISDVHCGKTFGDAIAIQGGTSTDNIVRNAFIKNVWMSLTGHTMRDWAPSTAYTTLDQVNNTKITCVAKANLVDGETVTIADVNNGLMTIKVYEFDVAGNGVSGTNVQVNVSTDTTAAQVAARLRTAVLATQSTLTVTDNTDGTLTIGGVAKASETVLDGGFIVSANSYKCVTGGTSAASGGPSGTGTGITDGTAVWDTMNGIRWGARAGITFQRGFDGVYIDDMYIERAQNAPWDMESTGAGPRKHLYARDVTLDNTNGNASIGPSIGSTADGFLEDSTFTNLTWYEGRTAVTYTKNVQLINPKCVVTQTFNNDPTLSLFEVRGVNDDLRVINCDFQRLGGTAGKVLDIENTGSRTTFEGGLIVQGTVASPTHVDGCPGGLYFNGMTIRYTAGSGASSFDALLVQAISGNVDVCHVDNLKVQCATGTLHGAVNLQVRHPRTLTNIRCTNISAQGEAGIGAYYGIGTTGSPVYDAHPMFGNIHAASAWEIVDQSDNPLADRVWPRLAALTTGHFEGYATPETNVTAPPGAVYSQIDGAAGLWFKAYGTAATGWLQPNEARPNLVRNGGFWFAQRQVPGTLTTYSDTAGRAFTADGWGVTNENASAQYQRIDTTNAPEAGLAARYYGTFKKITSAGKLVVSQVIEGSDANAVRGRTVRLQMKLKASTATDVRVGLLQLQAAGTVDTIPGTFVSAFGADGTDPTFGTNLAQIAPKSGVTLDNATSLANAAQCAVTTSWQRFGAVFDVPTDCENLLVCVWSDDDVGVDASISISEVSLTAGGEVQAWSPEDIDTELTRCLRYYQKTFNVDDAPVQNAGVGTGELNGVLTRAAATTEAAVIHWRFPVRMFRAPDLTLYNPAAANNQIRQINGTAADLTASTGDNTTEWTTTITGTGAATGVVGDRVAVHVSLNAEI